MIGSSYIAPLMVPGVSHVQQEPLFTTKNVGSVKLPERVHALVQVSLHQRKLFMKISLYILFVSINLMKIAPHANYKVSRPKDLFRMQYFF